MCIRYTAPRIFRSAWLYSYELPLQSMIYSVFSTGRHNNRESESNVCDCSSSTNRSTHFNPYRLGFWANKCFYNVYPFVESSPPSTIAPSTTTETVSEQELLNLHNNLNNYGQSSTFSVLLSEKGKFYFYAL